MEIKRVNEFLISDSNPEHPIIAISEIESIEFVGELSNNLKTLPNSIIFAMKKGEDKFWDYSEDKELAYKEYAQIKADLTKFIVSGDEVHRDGGVELK